MASDNEKDLDRINDTLLHGRKNNCKVTVISCEDKDSGDAQIQALLQSGLNAEPVVIDLKKAVPHPTEPNCYILPPGKEGHGKSYLQDTPGYSIHGNYPVTARIEFNVDYDGRGFLVIYGSHINGGFCCIPNWQFGCEMSTPDDTFYNTEMLERRFSHDIAKAIAYGIRDACAGAVSSLDQWIENKDGLVICSRCKTAHTVTESGSHLLSPYCPHCGTDLRASRAIGSFPPDTFQEVWKHKNNH